MDWANRSLQWVFYANIWLALGSGCITYYCITLLNYDFKWGNFTTQNYAFFVALITFTSYNFQRLVKSKTTNNSLSTRHIWISHHKKTLKIITVISGILSVFIAFMILDFSIIVASLPMGIVVLFYAQLMPRFKGIRSVPYLKNIVTAMVWCYAIIIAPIFYIQNNSKEFEITYSDYMMIMAVFIFILSISIPFDIRDVEHDKEKIKTMVILLGVKLSKKIMALCLLLCLLLCIYFEFWIFLGVSVLAIIMTLATHPKRGELFYSIFWDGMLVCFGIGMIIEKVALKFI